MHWLSAEGLARMWEQAVQAIATTGLRLAVILVVYWLARQAIVRVVRAALSRAQAGSLRRGASAGSEERLRRVMTLQTLVTSVVGYVLFFVLALTVLRTLGVDITGIVTTAGVAGVAVGFGAQKLVRDVISGFFIVTEDQFAVGDYVTIGQAVGNVEEMGLRMTRIRDDQGRLWSIANGDINQVVNHSRGPLCASLDISVPASQDPDVVTRTINEEGKALAEARKDLLSAAPSAEGIVAFDAGSYTVRVRIYPRPASSSSAEIAVRERLRSRLLEAGFIAPPPA
jgi:small conductance mechanosensitive channel